MRYWLIDLPAQLFDFGLRAYLTMLAALSLLAIVTAVLWLALSLAGYPLP